MIGTTTTTKFFGWRVVFASTIGLACGIATLGAATFSIFVGPIRAEMGWTQSSAYAALLAVTVTASLLSPLMGAIIDRFGARRVILFGFVAEVSVFASFALQDATLWSFYLRYFLFAALALGTTHVAFARVLTLWFDRRRGLALGIALSGVGLGGFVWPLYVQWMIDHYGWRTAYLLLAATIAIVVLPTILLFVRDDPGTLGQHRDGVASSLARASTTGTTLGVASRSPIFWLVLGTFFLIGFTVQGVQMHLVPLMTSRGISPMVAALAQSLLFLAVTSGRLVTGWLMDRFFAPRVALGFLLAPIIGIGLLSLELPTMMLVGAALMIGLAVGAEVDVLAYLTGRYFGTRHYARIYGSFYGAYSLSGGLGPLATAFVAERHGYSTAMLCLAGMLAVGCIMLYRFPQFAPDGHALR